VRESQRLRLLGACAELIAENGYAALTVASISSAAAVSKVAFYRQFKDVAECVLATYEMAADNAMAATRSACVSGERANTLPAAVSALLELLAAEPALAHVLTDQALEDIPALARSRTEFADRFAALLHILQERGGGDPARSPRISIHLVRAARAWLSMRLAVAPAGSLPTSAPELTSLLAG